MIEVLAVEDVTKRFNGHNVLNGITFNVAQGEVVSIIGPSGGGKTTLLRCIDHLERIDTGQIILNGMSTDRIPDRHIIRQQLGYVFQDINLWSHKTVLENLIEGPIVVQGIAKKEAIESGREMLRKVGVSEKANMYPAELSGGQKQRVAIARALVMKPAILLIDEITASLDPELIGEILRLIEALARDGTTILNVSHELPFVRDISSRILFLNNGVIEAEGSPSYIFCECDHAPLKRFIERFTRTHSDPYNGFLKCIK